MKIILSRKGFDSDFGGYPSLIMPEGRTISLPIPIKNPKDKSNFLYKDLKFDEKRSYLDVMQELGYKYDENSQCHLDPDIYRNIIDRHSSWRPLFGQTGAAQKHLQNEGVKEGDLFLFFGWFKETELIDNKLQLKKSDFDKHLIFGYFQIDKIINVIKKNDLFAEDLAEWMKYHPHNSDHHRISPNNTIYVAKESLTFNTNLPGAGCLKYNKDLVLTYEGKSRTIWKLPDLFRNIKISYHSQSCWKEDGSFKSVSRGQEFVIKDNKEVEKWAINLIEDNYFNL